MNRKMLEAENAVLKRRLDEMEAMIKRRTDKWYRAGDFLAFIENTREQLGQAAAKAEAECGAVPASERKARCYAAFL